MGRHTVVLAIAGLWGLLGQIQEFPRPPLPADAPSLAAVEATWQAFVEALSLGDREGLRQLTHSSRRHLLPDRLPPLVSEEGYQYGFCRPQQEFSRPREDEIAYLLVCEAAGERVMRFFYLRRDRDGVWRIMP